MTDGVCMEESAPENERSPQNSELDFPIDLKYLFGAAIGLLALLGFLFFWNISTELTCTRSAINLVECSLVRNTPLLRMSPTRIRFPAAVDVMTHLSDEGFYTYSVELRMSNVSYRLPLRRTRSYNSAYETADEINDFLLRSDAPSFFKRFP
jgi:hypothetical protein